PQNDVTLKMPAFEWVHVQLHQQKGMISLSPPTICNSASQSGTAFWWLSGGACLRPDYRSGAYPAEDCTGCFTCSGGTPTVRLNRACLLIIYLLLLNLILKRILI
ncbi:hypothetical protein OFS96_26750, partial [Escherichia coli]|nr:hypothetical protein [Escherichia coli]